jgi:hypothetical protein
MEVERLDQRGFEWPGEEEGNELKDDQLLVEFS